MRSKLPLFALSVVICLALAACGNSPSGGSDETVKIRIGDIYAPDTTFGKALDKMASNIQKASHGSIDVQVFHNGSLGSEEDEIGAVREGSLEMMETGTAGIGLYVPATAVFELWYANDSVATLKAAFDQVTPDLEKAYSAKGFELLGAYYDGPRNILSTKPIHTLGDLKGMKFRVPDSKLYAASASALGANAVSMPLGDVYTALQTGAVQAMEGTPDSIYQAKTYEAAKYYVMDKHVYQPLSIVYNKASWEQLSPSQQKIVRDAVSASSKYQLSLLQKANSEALSGMKDAGVTVQGISDRSAWAAAVQASNRKFVNQQGSLGQKILSAMNSQAS